MVLERMMLPFMLAVAAGLATAIGGAAPFFIKELKPSLLRLVLGFSAGVMLYVSFTELLGAGIKEVGFMWANLAFFAGMGLMALLDMLIPHEYLLERFSNGSHDNDRLLKAGLLTAAGIMIHNFPEGIAVFASAMKDVNLGGALALAIGLHNIPEGLAVAVPAYAATGRRGWAFGLALLAGLAEPLGALLVGFWLVPFLTPVVMAVTLSMVGGLMTFISFDEILPSSYVHGMEEGNFTAHEAIAGIVLGMMVMATSLTIF